MRNLFTKLGTGALLTAAALAVSACGHKSDTANTADTNMTDMNTMDSSAGMSNDASAMDGSSNAMTGGDNMMDNAAGGNASNASNAM